MGQRCWRLPAATALHHVGPTTIGATPFFSNIIGFGVVPLGPGAAQGCHRRRRRRRLGCTAGWSNSGASKNLVISALRKHDHFGCPFAIISDDPGSPKVMAQGHPIWPHAPVHPRTEANALHDSREIPNAPRDLYWPTMRCNGLCDRVMTEAALAIAKCRYASSATSSDSSDCSRSPSRDRTSRRAPLSAEGRNFKGLQ